ncbi:MAG TPA: tetratricopeptide repeat protein, partial [Rhizomicrobium sp.]|nr:tetratricopeptide repeat protein [Rhizomicrobium sp.]
MNQLFARASHAQQQGDLSGAAVLYGEILQAAPSDIPALTNLGAIFYAQGRLDEAISLLERACVAAPHNPDLVMNLVLVMRQAGRREDALAACDHLVSLWPGFAAAWTARGGLLQTLGRQMEALDCYDRALALNPGDYEALNNRGIIYCESGDCEKALHSLDQAIAIAPGAGHAHNNRGNALRSLGRLDEALESYRRAQALDPGYADAFFNYGETCLGIGQFDEAASAFRRTEMLAPDMPNLKGALLYAKLQLCDWSDYAQRCEELLQAAGRGLIQPHTFLLLPASSAQQLTCARAYDRHQPGNAAPPARETGKGTRKRIAYVSGAFRDHPVMQLVCDVFALHDRSRYEVFAFSLMRSDGSALLAKMEKSFDHFIDAHAMSDAAIAEMIAAHGIDLAIDLDGHTEGSRTSILAQRPAPIQVNWLGYPGTMGMSHIDFIIADRHVLPPGEEGFFSERVLRMPVTYQPNSERPVLGPMPSRAELGLPDRGFVFCCFNNPSKISPDVFSIWMGLLKAVPGSVLWLWCDRPAARRNLLQEAVAHGVDEARLVFAPSVDRKKHLDRMQAADLFLDTFHYNAHTTASDALWAGLPVLTRTGGAFAARVAASLLHAAGLPELVTDSSLAYEQLALKLARDPDLLSSVRE